MVLTTIFRCCNEDPSKLYRMLWTGASAEVSESFKELLLELAHERSLGDLLPLITRRLVEHEDVALARLWLLLPGDTCGTCRNARACSDRTRCLHLVASASRSRTGHIEARGALDGAFRRIPVGAFKVGQVAATRADVLVEDPQLDPKIRHPDWVRAEGVAGFVGLPLICRGEPVGVLGVFVRTKISRSAVDVLRIIANHAAAAIVTARLLAQTESMRRQLAAENEQLRKRTLEDATEGLVGHGPKLAKVLQQVDAVAPTDATVVLLGESGTGKELVARAIHRRSLRAAGPFVEINCAAIPRELAESELFGHVKGAFSGAVRDRVGRFEAATGGTLFLDEVGELPLELQGKLLRVLQEGTYERVGEVEPRRTDLRLIAATNRDLLADATVGHFRQDLYYRLSVYPILLPALRDRREDIPELAAHLLDRICRRLHKPPHKLTPEHIAELSGRDWPGNVRELHNVLERAVISSAGGELDLPEADVQRRAPPVSAWISAIEGPRPTRAAGPPADAVVTDAEMRHRDRENLRRALEQCRGRIYGAGGAAALLGLKPTTLMSRLKRAGLDRAALP